MSRYEYNYFIIIILLLSDLFDTFWISNLILRLFSKASYKKSFIDVDECKRGTHNCDKDTHKCVNKVGGYICKRTGCKPGYKFVDGRCDGM